MKNWKDITLKQFYQIQDLLQEPDEYTTFNLLDAIYGVDSASFTINEFAKYAKALEFLKDEMPEVKLKDSYELNGTTYAVNFDLSAVNVAQFLDYQNYIKKDKPLYEEILSVFFIPQGCKYNDGNYSIKKVIEDLRCLDIVTVQSAAFFFGRQFRVFLALFQFYLIRMIRKLKIEKKQKKELIAKIKEADFISLGQYLTYLNTLK